MARTLASWQNAAKSSTADRLSAATTNNRLSSLYEWGPLQFLVWPLNVHEVDVETATDWAKKEIVGAATYLEWVGENDELIFLRGRVFPYRVGGMGELEVFDSMRREGISSMLIRGRGEVLGWFVCERLQRQHTYLSGEGVGRMVTFEAVMARVPMPDSADYVAQLWRTITT